MAGTYPQDSYGIQEGLVRILKSDETPVRVGAARRCGEDNPPRGLNSKQIWDTAGHVLPCFSLSCKANARVKIAKTGHSPHSSQLVVIVLLLLFVLFYVLFVCKCVLYHRHRVYTQLQLTNIPYPKFDDDDKEEPTAN